MKIVTNDLFYVNDVYKNEYAIVNYNTVNYNLQKNHNLFLNKINRKLFNVNNFACILINILINEHVRTYTMNYLPSSLRNIVFKKSFNSDIFNFPNNLRSIELGCCYNRKIVKIPFKIHVIKHSNCYEINKLKFKINILKVEYENNCSQLYRNCRGNTNETFNSCINIPRIKYNEIDTKNRYNRYGGYYGRDEDYSDYSDYSDYDNDDNDDDDDDDDGYYSDYY